MMKRLVFLVLGLVLSLQAMQNVPIQKTNLGVAGALIEAQGEEFASVTFQISGTWVGTITFEGTITGTWVEINATDINSGSKSTTATDNGIYIINTVGLKKVRARMSSYTSGTAVVGGYAADETGTLVTSASGGGAGTEVDVLSIAAGNNNIGNVDVVTLPALAAGTANIGDVDVASIAAGDNNIGNVDVVTLPALAAGTNNIGDVDVLSLNDGGNSVTVDNGGTFAVQAGQAAHDAAIAGNPVRMGVRAVTSDYTAVATGDQADAIGTVDGKQVVKPYAIRGSSWSYAAASGGITDNSAVTIKAAAAAGIRNCLTSIQVINGHATVSTELSVRDGSGGTVLHRGYALAAGGGYSVQLPVPICGTAATLLEVICGTTGSAVYVNAQGYISAE